VLQSDVKRVDEVVAAVLADDEADIDSSWDGSEAD
jgi:hypothetical protein